jgi:hypothetical protein
MKNTLFIFLSTLFMGSFFFTACVHEIPHDFCASDPITLEIATTDASGTQNNGVIVSTATGGSGFQYSLNGALFTDNGTFTGLHPNTSYRVVAKNSWGCTDTAEVLIGLITPPNPCVGVTITVNSTVANASPNQSNGTITASASPAGAYTYSVNNGAFQPSGTFTGLAAGNYTITAMSVGGCTGTGQATIGTNDPCSGVTVVVNASSTNPTTGQSNGSITASATGGSGFTYSINNGTFQASGNFTGLATGNYTITAKNSNGCTGVTTIALGSTDPCAGVTVVVSATSTNPTTGQSNGSITATATGGSGFTYSINGGAFQASGTFTGLVTGNYTITAKNANGCTGVKTVALGATNPCAGVTITVSTTKVDPTTGQSNGSITASATGATGFTYSINNGAYQASGTFTGLAAGTYTVTAKSSAGCLGSTTVTLTATNPCTGVTIVVSTTKVDPTSGANGSITASATGATGFTYSLNNGTFQASGTFTGLAAGTYTVTAKSSAGCLGSTTVTLTTANPCTSTVINLTSTIVNVIPCSTPAANGSITLAASGSSGYTYNINGGAYQASSIFSSLAAGAFTVGVKDVNGCTKTASATVGTAVSGPLFAQVRTLITNRCSGSGCHTNGGNAAGYNFDTDCKIVGYWSQINRSTVLYTMIKMPKSPQALFTAAEKLIITNWVNAGHTYGN